MKRVCAFCNTVINPGDSPGEPVSHGICNDCSLRALSRLGIDIARYIDMPGAPVILVNKDVRIHDVSFEAVRFIGRPLDPILGILAGGTQGCTHAGQPGGCGRTVWCSGCAIRNAVRTTYETGERSTGVSLYSSREIRKRPGRSISSSQQEKRGPSSLSASNRLTQAPWRPPRYNGTKEKLFSRRYWSPVMMIRTMSAF